MNFKGVKKVALLRFRFWTTISMFFVFLLLSTSVVVAENKEEQNIYKERLALYKKTAAITHVPWYYIAAIDHYERNMQQSSPEEDDLISIHFEPEVWFGVGNIDHHSHVASIELFSGIGQDGDGDGKADIDNPEDILFTTALLLSANGITEDDIKISLWNHYHRDLSVKTIQNTANVFKHFKTIELTDRDFPVDINYNYSYRSTWGHGRGFGGRRIHEGTDIFANYGTPVKSTTYGVVELKGWNLYGGWRIGIRDIYNIYHYYAHLNSYAEDIEVGDIVKPGDVLGTVGATGYGPPGTSGKFPPHLHYGMYKDNGHSEWSFDPYPYLKRWERIAKGKR
mgnify:CR=1 FL=1